MRLTYRRHERWISSIFGQAVFERRYSLVFNQGEVSGLTALVTATAANLPQLAPTTTRLTARVADLTIRRAMCLSHEFVLLRLVGTGLIFKSDKDTFTPARDQASDNLLRNVLGRVVQELLELLV